MHRRTQKLEMDGERKSHVMAFVWGVVILAAFAGVLFYAYKVGSGKDPAEYEGTIVDKWAGYNESLIGSDPYFRLVVETGNGRRLTVSVNMEIYNTAKVGSRIKKSTRGIELFDAGNTG